MDNIEILGTIGESEFGYVLYNVLDLPTNTKTKTEFCVCTKELPNSIDYGLWCKIVDSVLINLLGHKVKSISGYGVTDSQCINTRRDFEAEKIFSESQNIFNPSYLYVHGVVEIIMNIKNHNNEYTEFEAIFNFFVDGKNIGWPKKEIRS